MFNDPLRRAVRIGGVVAAVAVTGRSIATAGNDEAHWIVVARDSGYTISIDTTRIISESGHTYEVWYRTDHAVTRFYKEKAFTRETVHAILRCDSYKFRIMSTAMSMGSKRPVTTQIMEGRDLERQSWRRVEAGSTEADAARATCVVADWAASSRRSSRRD
jgi:hypothetical protein